MGVTLCYYTIKKIRIFRKHYPDNTALSFVALNSVKIKIQALTWILSKAFIQILFAHRAIAEAAK